MKQTPPRELDLQSSTMLPFFDDEHRRLATELSSWCAKQEIDESDDRAACREWVRRLGDAGWLRWCVPARVGGQREAIDSRALVIIRETLAYYSALADFSFAMQGLGSGAISLAGPENHEALLAKVGRGQAIAAFALSEPQAGSDVAALATQAIRRDSQSWVLNGTKTWISNGGIADFYCVFARVVQEGIASSRGTQGLECFVVSSNTRGLDTSKLIQVIAPHPLATLQFTECELPSSSRLGQSTQGEGFKLAMRVLDVFRPSVAGASLGMARRALAEAAHFAKNRPMFGGTLADQQITQAKLGEMSALIDSGAMLTYRTAWLRDVQGLRTTTEAAIAKLTATENAQRVIDAAVQIHGGIGVMYGSAVEALYRDIRALRIYEGASEVQQLIIGKAVLNA